MKRADQTWAEAFAEIRSTLRQWRAEHEDATLQEIEEMTDELLAGLRAGMIEEAAHQSRLAHIEQLPEAERPHCPACQTPLQANGRQRRQLVTTHEEAIELRRSQARCPQCGYTVFPPG